MTTRQSPSEVLSAELVDRLIAAGLFRADKRDTLIAKIAVGDMKGEDWRLEIDLAQAKVETVPE
jgi:hypothetical protein